jgi:hypothetical protein
LGWAGRVVPGDRKEIPMSTQTIHAEAPLLVSRPHRTAVATPRERTPAPALLAAILLSNAALVLFMISRFF